MDYNRLPVFLMVSVKWMQTGMLVFGTLAQLGIWSLVKLENTVVTSYSVKVRTEVGGEEGFEWKS